MVKKGLQIGSDSEEEEEQQQEVKQQPVKEKKEIEHKQKESNKSNGKRKHSNDSNASETNHKKENLHKKKQEKIEEKKQFKQENNEIENKKQKKQRKESVDTISDLFISDHTDDFSDINNIKAELEEEERQKKIREQKRQEKREREEKERQERKKQERAREEKRLEERRQKEKQSSSSRPTQERSYNNRKEALVYEFLLRWWYVWEDWPPREFDYDEVLEQKKYKVYDYQKFRKVPDVDDNGYSKLMPVEGYTGCYFNAESKFIDLRPLKNKPSVNYVRTLPESEIKQLLVRALQEQIKQLEKYQEDSEDPTRGLINSLQKQLSRLQR